MPFGAPSHLPPAFHFCEFTVVRKNRQTAKPVLLVGGGAGGGESENTFTKYINNKNKKKSGSKNIKLRVKKIKKVEKNSGGI